MAVCDKNGVQIDNSSSGGLIRNPYLTEELKDAIQTAKEKVEKINHSNSCCNFLYLTDLHLSGDGQLMQGKSIVNPYYSLAVVKEICKQGWVECVVFGGDLINAYTQNYTPLLTDACKRITDCLKYLHDFGIPCYFVKGNHDLNSKYDQENNNTLYPNKINDSTWNLLTRSFEDNAVRNLSDDAGYFYVDLSNNVRLCVWNQYTGSCIDSTGNDGNGTSVTESNWFRDNAFKENKTIVTLYHNPEQYTSYQSMYTRFFADGGNYGGKEWAGGGKAIIINSHLHKDKFGYSYPGTMRQNIPEFTVDRAFSIEKSTATNVPLDTGINKACVSIFSISDNHVWMTRIGRGQDKDTDFCTVE